MINFEPISIKNVLINEKVVWLMMNLFNPIKAPTRYN